MVCVTCQQRAADSVQTLHADPHLKSGSKDADTQQAGPLRPLVTCLSFLRSIDRTSGQFLASLAGAPLDLEICRHTGNANREDVA
eukprot:m.17952 g.17952  ORF g.17952 m.17952 type:complete len:85 (-) comp9461_c0_seq1:30-284(-)